MKKFLIVLIILFVCGLLSADVCLKEIEDNAVVGREVYEQYASAKLTFKNVFWDVLYERIKLFGVLFILCFTPIKEKMGLVLAPVFSFVWGFFLMSSIIELGFVGLIVGLASVLPHGILDCGSVWLMLRNNRTRTYLVREKMMINMASYIGIVLLFITGCILESFMGSYFIPWVIRLSMI